ncbi:MAG: hypothetical protein ACRC2T_03820, partial [Thermoguttaceae bacterium]
DDSGAENAKATSAIMDIAIHGIQAAQTELVGSIKDPAATPNLNLNDFFPNYTSATLKKVETGSGHDSDILTNFAQIKGMIGNKFNAGSTILTNFVSVDQYSKDLDFSPIYLTFTVETESGTEDRTITIRLEEQYTTNVYIFPTNTPTKRSEFFSDKYPGGIIYDANNPFVPTGDTYYLEIWMQDLVNKEVGPGISDGLAAINFELLFNGKFVTIDTSEINYANGSLPFGTPTVINADGSEAILTGYANGTRSGIVVGLGERGLGVYQNGWISIQIPVTVTGGGDPNFRFEDIGFTWKVQRFDGPNTEPIEYPISQTQVKVITPVIQQTKAGSELNALITPEKEVDGGVYMRTVTTPTDTRADGTVGSLPKDANMLTEWDTHYVELWVKASEAEKFTSASTDLRYNTSYFTATSVELGNYFNLGGNWKIDDASGLVSGIGGGVKTIVEKDGYILLGRVKFESIGTDNVKWSESLTPHSLGLKLENAGVRAMSGELISVVGKGSSTELWANPYDSMDSGNVTFSDFTRFVSVYGSTGTSDTPLLSGFDFTKSGSVGFSDFTLFVSNYGLTRDAVRTGAASLKLPSNFTQRYVGQTLQADDMASVGKLLDAANKAWADALGLDKPLDIKLAVKDFGDSTTLGEALITAVDEHGVPTQGIITLDNDAAGLGWYSQITDPVNASKYDLYTTLLHELGHIYGINSAYNAYNAVKGQYGNLLDTTGHVKTESDVMFAGLNTGERKYLSELDVNIITTAYGAAFGNNALKGFVKEAAKMEAYGDKVADSVSDAVQATQFAVPTAVIAQNTGSVDVMLNASVPAERVPSILDTESNAKTLAELNKMGLAVSLPNVTPTGSILASTDAVLNDLFGDSDSEDENEFDYLVEQSTEDNATLLDQVLAELI